MPDLQPAPHRIVQSPTLALRRGEPRGCLAAWLAEGRGDDALLVVHFPLSVYWLDEQPEQMLTALYCRTGDQLEVAVTDAALHTDGSSGPRQFARWAAEHALVIARPGVPMGLGRIHIPKPWGQEIWYTGVETRGVCEFVSDEGATPIPWLQAAMPDDDFGQPGRALVLLKILDPVADAVTGDLYFELHEEKREVYVVTAVDARAWPDGTGAIRYGFSTEKRADYRDDGAFREAYLEAVSRYEAVRRAIDANPEVAGRDLVERERQLRAEMDSFTDLRPLRVGDVVRVPLRLPHSLQHGVRTIEFQTPVYERKILSFCQQVLTQDHWDTREAVAVMSLEPAQGDDLVQVHDSPGHRVERIVDFEDFEVFRITLAGGQAHAVPAADSYALTITVKGTLEAGGKRAGAEEALLLPRHWRGRLAPVEPDGELVVLLARPRRDGS